MQGPTYTLYIHNSTARYPFGRRDYTDTKTNMPTEQIGACLLLKGGPWPYDTILHKNVRFVFGNVTDMGNAS